MDENVQESDMSPEDRARFEQYRENLAAAHEEVISMGKSFRNSVPKFRRIITHTSNYVEFI